MKRRLSSRRFKQYLRLTREEAERQLLEKAYPQSDTKKRRLVELDNPDDMKRLETLLKQLKKASSPIVWIRLVVALVISSAITVFFVLFLDSILQRRIEDGLEYLTRTDVGLSNFDLQVFRGRISVDKLTFASLDDPMMNRLEFDNMAFDLNIPAILRRRAVFDALTGNLAIDVPRKRSAVYPQFDDSNEDEENSLSSFRFSDDWIPIPEIPKRSIALSEELKLEAEAEYRDWSTAIENQISQIETIIEQTENFLAKPLPDALNIAEWLTRIEEANNLIGEVNAIKIETEQRIQSAANTIQRSKNRINSIRDALEKDFADIQEALRLDSGFVNQFMQAALAEYAGPKAASFLGLFQRYKDRISEIVSSNSAGKTSTTAGKRLKRGRIISFPVYLPPRFMINHIELGGPGLQILGSNVGVDHHLIGKASIISLQLTSDSGLPASLKADVTFDGRTEAEKVLSIEYEVSDFPASFGDLSTELVFSGVMDTQDIVNSFGAGGRADILSWDGSIRGESFDIEMTKAPALGFSYQGQFSSSENQIQMQIDSASLDVWIDFLSEAVLPDGIKAAKETLQSAIEGNLDSLEDLAADLETLVEQLTGQDEILESVEKELENAVRNWTETSLPKEVPTEIIDDAIDVLKSFF